MFSKLVARNSKKNRESSGLYFGAMIISIIAFYIILSLYNQDVMLFLKDMESDAVNRLFTIIPVFYAATLFMLLFLVYFASSMQMEKRKREFGVYLTLGMRRSKLFLMLLLEDLRNNAIALGIGLPVAVMISELISLVTAKVVGLGIIGHKFSLSLTAVLFTIIGFLLVKLIVSVLLSARTAKKEIWDLIAYSPSGMKKPLPSFIYIISLILGVLMLAKAYIYGTGGEAWNDRRNMGITVLLGAAGTVLLFFGMRLVIGALAKSKSKEKLHTFNFRQVQELVINRSALLAVCSLLIFSALCLFGAGIAISISGSNDNLHILDYTFKDASFTSEENLDSDKVRKQLADEGIESDFSNIIEIKVGNTSAISLKSLTDAMQALADNESKETLTDNFKKHDDYCYLISVTGYNDLRESANLEPIYLKENEACLYMGKEFINDENFMNSVVKTNPVIKVLGEDLKITGDIQSLPIVTDRAITLFAALIVNDYAFNRYTGGKYSSYVSGVLNNEIVKEKGLMQAIFDTNEKLNKTSLEYESFIKNIGRHLFFAVSASYITIYLAVIFLVSANTIIGVLFLMGQEKSYKRYHTLVHLGATHETLCKSCKKQINWYFGLPAFVAVINSFFGVYSLFTGILPSSARVNIKQEFIIAALIIALLGLFETVYISVVKKSSSKYLCTLMEPVREE